MVMRYRLSACGLTDRTSPTSVTMPVNMSGPGKRIERVGPERLAATCLHLPGHAFERRDASFADHPGAAQQRHFVYQSCGSHATRELRAAFHHYAGDALLGENLEHFLKIELPVVIADPEDLAALLLQDFLGDGRWPARGEHPRGRLPHRRYRRGHQRQLQRGVEHDAHRRALEHAR